MRHLYQSQSSDKLRTLSPACSMRVCPVRPYLAAPPIMVNTSDITDLSSTGPSPFAPKSFFHFRWWNLKVTLRCQYVHKRDPQAIKKMEAKIPVFRSSTMSIRTGASDHRRRVSLQGLWRSRWIGIPDRYNVGSQLDKVKMISAVRSGVIRVLQKIRKYATSWVCSRLKWFYVQIRLMNKCTISLIKWVVTCKM